jgi:hypothetical protein
MNERDKELLQQAEEYAAQNATGDWEVGPAYQDLFNKKFAELIRADEREVRSVRWDDLIAKAIEVEREACAKLVDHILKEGGGTYGDAIKARGNA